MNSAPDMTERRRDPTMVEREADQEIENEIETTEEIGREIDIERKITGEKKEMVVTDKEEKREEREEENALHPSKLERMRTKGLPDRLQRKEEQCLLSGMMMRRDSKQ